jgi:hypothetical protein
VSILKCIVTVMKSHCSWHHQSWRHWYNHGTEIHDQ